MRRLVWLSLVQFVAWLGWWVLAYPLGFWRMVGLLVVTVALAVLAREVGAARQEVLRG